MKREGKRVFAKVVFFLRGGELCTRLDRAAMIGERHLRASARLAATNAAQRAQAERISDLMEQLVLGSGIAFYTERPCL